MKQGTEYYTPSDVAKVLGQSVYTAREYLHEASKRLGLSHEARSWWRFSAAEFQTILADLQTEDPSRRRGGLRHRKPRRHG